MSGMNVTAMRAGLAPIGPALSATRSWPRRRWVAALAAAVLVAVILGVPTGILHTTLYMRMTPVTWWDYPVWAASALLAGLTFATYLGPTREAPRTDRARRSLVATVAAGLAVGCPICNKVVVMAIGVSGALSYWAPLQPILGIASVGLLLVGLLVRLRGEIACPVRVAVTGPPSNDLSRH